jgi:hypothetical protein
LTPYLNNTELVCDGFGLRCCEVDIRRLKSLFLDALLECAKNEGSKRLLLPKGLFDSLAFMRDFLYFFAHPMIRFHVEQ